MYPYFVFFSIRLPTFPFIIFFALFLTGIVYIKSKQYPKIFILDMFRKVVPILVGAAIGARLLSAITLIPLSDRPFWYNLLFGGSVFYGGIIGGCVGLAIVCAIKKQPFLEYTDVIVSLLPLGHAIGRIGCFLNGCCYGCKYEGFLSVDYPVNGEFVKVFPTWFVESLFCILLFVFFHFVCKTTIRGVRTSIYFITYSCYRFLIEFVRGDDIRGIWGLLSSSQIISALMLLFGVFVLLYSNKHKMYNYMILKGINNNETR